MVRKRTVLCFGLLCVLLVLTGCVGTVSPLCFSNGSAAPPTVAQGPVTISMEHAIYAPSDTITAIITNTLDTTIYMRSAPGCRILLLRQKVNSEWHSISRCGMTENAPTVIDDAIPAHTSSPFTLSTGAGGPLNMLPEGTYRTGLDYSTHKPDPDQRVLLESPSEVWSADFQVCTCRSC